MNSEHEATRRDENGDVHGATRMWHLFFLLNERHARRQYERELEYPEFVDLGGEG
jgi:hypothetical protein